MAKYVYPAKLSNDDGKMMVEFPDVPNCFTEGDTLTEAIELAEDALCMILCDIEDKTKELPTPSDIATIKCEEGEVIAVVKADTLSYRKRTNGKAVKKTLTIPAWLNEMAEQNKVNYSQILQEALIQRLGQ